MDTNKRSASEMSATEVEPFVLPKIHIPTNGKLLNPVLTVFKIYMSDIRNGIRRKKNNDSSLFWLQLNLHMPRLADMPPRFIGLQLWNNSAEQMHSTMMFDVIEYENSGKNYLLYQWPLRHPWMLLPPTLADKEHRGNCCVGMLKLASGTINFENSFVPELIEENESQLQFVFEDNPNELLLHPSLWDLVSYGTTKSPLSPCRLQKRSRIQCVADVEELKHQSTLMNEELKESVEEISDLKASGDAAKDTD
jgi:hypothetical protein